MPQIPNIISEVLIFTADDAGSGMSASISAQGETLLELSSLNIEDRLTAIQQLREGLADLFEEVWGKPVDVSFDYEAWSEEQ